MRLAWIPEAPGHPGVYAIKYERIRVIYRNKGQVQNCTMNPHEALQFERREECALWCKEHPTPVFIPMEHGFE